MPQAFSPTRPSLFIPSPRTSNHVSPRSPRSRDPLHWGPDAVSRHIQRKVSKDKSPLLVKLVVEKQIDGRAILRSPRDVVERGIGLGETELGREFMAVVDDMRAKTFLPPSPPRRYRSLTEICEELNEQPSPAASIMGNATPELAPATSASPPPTPPDWDYDEVTNGADLQPFLYPRHADGHYLGWSTDAHTYAPLLHPFAPSSPESAHVLSAIHVPRPLRASISSLATHLEDMSSADHGDHHGPTHDAQSHGDLLGRAAAPLNQRRVSTHSDHPRMSRNQRPALQPPHPRGRSRSCPPERPTRQIQPPPLASHALPPPPLRRPTPPPPKHYEEVAVQTQEFVDVEVQTDIVGWRSPHQTTAPLIPADASPQNSATTRDTDPDRSTSAPQNATATDGVEDLRAELPANVDELREAASGTSSAIHATNPDPLPEKTTDEEPVQPAQDTSPSAVADSTSGGATRPVEHAASTDLVKAKLPPVEVAASPVTTKGKSPAVSNKTTPVGRRTAKEVSVASSKPLDAKREEARREEARREEARREEARREEAKREEARREEARREEARREEARREEARREEAKQKKIEKAALQSATTASDTAPPTASKVSANSAGQRKTGQSTQQAAAPASSTKPNPVKGIQDIIQSTSNTTVVASSSKLSTPVDGTQGSRAAAKVGGTSKNDVVPEPSKPGIVQESTARAEDLITSSNVTSGDKAKQDSTQLASQDLHKPNLTKGPTIVATAERSTKVSGDYVAPAQTTPPPEAGRSDQNKGAVNSQTEDKLRRKPQLSLNIGGRDESSNAAGLRNHSADTKPPTASIVQKPGPISWPAPSENPQGHLRKTSTTDAPRFAGSSQAASTPPAQGGRGTSTFGSAKGPSSTQSFGPVATTWGAGRGTTGGSTNFGFAQNPGRAATAGIPSRGSAGQTQESCLTTERTHSATLDSRTTPTQHPVVTPSATPPPSTNRPWYTRFASSILGSESADSDKDDTPPPRNVPATQSGLPKYPQPSAVDYTRDRARSHKVTAASADPRPSVAASSNTTRPNAQLRASATTFTPSGASRNTTPPVDQLASVESSGKDSQSIGEQQEEECQASTSQQKSSKGKEREVDSAEAVAEPESTVLAPLASAKDTIAVGGSTKPDDASVDATQAHTNGEDSQVALVRAASQNPAANGAEVVRSNNDASASVDTTEVTTKDVQGEPKTDAITASPAPISPSQIALPSDSDEDSGTNVRTVPPLQTTTQETVLVSSTTEQSVTPPQDPNPTTTSHPQEPRSDADVTTTLASEAGVEPDSKASAQKSNLDLAGSSTAVAPPELGAGAGTPIVQGSTTQGEHTSGSAEGVDAQKSPLDNELWQAVDYTETQTTAAKGDADGEGEFVKIDKSGEVEPDEVKPDEVKPDEVKPDEVKANEVKAPLNPIVTALAADPSAQNSPAEATTPTTEMPEESGADSKDASAKSKEEKEKERKKLKKKRQQANAKGKTIDNIYAS